MPKRNFQKAISNSTITSSEQEKQQKIPLEFSYLKPEITTKIAIGSCLLRNLLRTLSAASYSPAGYSEKILDDKAIIEGQWINKDSSSYIYAFEPARSKHATVPADNVKNIF